MLHFACIGGNLDIVTRAVGLGLDVNSTDKVRMLVFNKWGFVPTIFMCVCTHLNSVELVKHINTSIVFD